VTPTSIAGTSGPARPTTSRAWTASDVNGLVGRLRGIDQIILTRPDDRDERLRAIEGRLKG